MSTTKSKSPDKEDDDGPPYVQRSQAEIDAFLAKIDALRAQNEAEGRAMVRSWMIPEVREAYDKRMSRTQAEIDEEDARLFQAQPLYLGVGADIPADFLATDAQSGNKALRAKLLPATTLKASKKRDQEEKEASRKRGLKQESSDDEAEGRSALGKKKKQKIDSARPPSAVNPLITRGALDHDSKQTLVEQSKSGGEEEVNGVNKSIEVAHNTESTQIKKKKKKKKKKRKNSTVEEVDDDLNSLPASTHVELPLSRKTEKSMGSEAEKQQLVEKSEVVTEEDDSAKSREQRKKDKKARKEERRRLKSLQ